MSTARPESTGRAAARLDGERSRARILDAAERLLAEHGFSGTGIAAISRESGLPASSIYWFFASKRDLCEAVVARAAERWLDTLERPADDGTTITSNIRSFFERGLEQSGSRLPDFLRLTVLLGLERGDDDPELREHFRSASDRMSALMADAIEQSLPDEDPEALRRVANEMAPLARGLAMGTLISRHIEPGLIDLEGLPEDLEIAILAIARAHLQRGARDAR